MEFLPCNLLELLDAQPGGMDKEAVRLILFQLCSAIAFIHGQVRAFTSHYSCFRSVNGILQSHAVVALSSCWSPATKRDGDGMHSRAHCLHAALLAVHLRSRVLWHVSQTTAARLRYNSYQPHMCNAQ